MDIAERAREHVLDAHRGLVETVAACGSKAAADLPTPADRRVATARLELALREAGVLTDLVGVVRSTAAALELDLPAEPVAAPPYVVVTARGPMLRATVDAGRLVVLFRTFERTPGGYVPADVTPESAVEVTFHDA